MTPTPPSLGRGRASALLCTHTHAHTHVCTHTHTSPCLVWVLGASSPVIKSRGGTNIYFREEVAVAVRTDSGWGGHTNHTVDKPSTEQPAAQTPGLEAGPTTPSGIHGWRRTQKWHAGD